MNTEKRHVFDDPRNVKRLLWVLYVICSGLVLIDFVHHRHAVHSWESMWGFYAAFGFVACVALVLIAKEMRKILMRGETYYDAE